MNNLEIVKTLWSLISLVGDDGSRSFVRGLDLSLCDIMEIRRLLFNKKEYDLIYGANESGELQLRFRLGSKILFDELYISRSAQEEALKDVSGFSAYYLTNFKNCPQSFKEKMINSGNGNLVRFAIEFFKDDEVVMKRLIATGEHDLTIKRVMNPVKRSRI